MYRWNLTLRRPRRDPLDGFLAKGLYEVAVYFEATRLLDASRAEQVLAERKLPGFDFKTNKLCMAVDTRNNRTVWRWPANGT